MSRKSDKNKKAAAPAQKHGVLSNIAYMLSYAFRYTPALVVTTVIWAVIGGLSNTFTNVLAMKMLFDEVERQSFEGALRVFLLWLAVELIYNVSNWIFWGIWYKKQQLKLQVKIHGSMFEKVRSLDLACYDDPDFYNDYVWAMNESDVRATEIIKSIHRTVSQLTSVSSLIALIAATNPFILIVISVSVAVTVATDMAGQKIGLKQNEENLPINRRIDYLKRVFSFPDYAKEIRLSDVKDLLIAKFRDLNRRQKDINVRYGKKKLAINFAVKLLETGLCTMGISIWLIVRLFMGLTRLGDFAASQSAVWGLYGNVKSIIRQFVSYREHSIYIEKFRKFMDYRPLITGGTEKVEDIREISLENVSFTYPGADHPTLSDISFKISKGEHIAIVGYNGAGKTTLMKLLLSLYAPSSGKIMYNGREVSEYDLEEYRRSFGVVFLDYRLFAATIAENIVGDVYDESKYTDVVRAMEISGFKEKIDGSDITVDTPLMKEFNKNGITLSGGESQKLALARALCNEHGILIFDEPSSAIDPVAEYNINRSIVENTKGKTVIIISHRLATTRFADRILMFDSGRIIEEGSHEELMAMNGKYAEMFNVQAQKYESGVVNKGQLQGV